jgi:hypothetical protein
MVKNQQCKNCKNHFADNAPQRNYSLYADYGFSSEEKFRSHSSKNKNCPYKSVLSVAAYDENSSVSSGDSVPNITMDVSEVEWGPVIQNISISPEDHVDNQEMLQIKLNKHNRGGNPLWFENSLDTAYTILSHILGPTVQSITVVGEPGVGKTALIHCLIYLLSMLSYEKAIHPNCITLTTGMSDTDWYEQLLKAFKLRDGAFLMESLYAIKDNHCITHRSNFHKRITWLLNHPEYISNAIFIIDEHHFADDVDMTLDSEFKRLGLTEEKMKEYNIKIINVSATPDVSLSIMSKKDNHKMVILQNGPNYKGFEYYKNHNMILDYTNDIDLEGLIRKKYSTPRYHFIRARTQQEKGVYRENTVSIAKKNGWDVIEDDSDHNYYLSFKQDEYERNAELQGKSIIRTYLAPERHTVIIIKNKYPASKRLKLTKYTGLIMEKPAEKMNTTVTCNGLIPRFWGYEDLPDFPHNQKPLFICNKKSVDEYIKFKEDFVYNGKSYTSNRIKSDETKLKELKTTWLCNLANASPSAYDTTIGITNGKTGERRWFDNVGEIAPFLREKGFESVRDISEFSQGPNGYIWPRRNPDHNSEETRLIRSVYEEKFIKNGGGTHINRQWNAGGSGQPYMIWPVYETLDSPPESVKYYVHYLKLRR